MTASSIRFAIALPIAALLVSLLLLLPYASSLAAQMKAAVSPMTAAPATAPVAHGEEERRYAQVAALNLPALLAELPTALVGDDRSSWSPAGMDFRVWRALSYPVVGLFFWWLVGRGADALRRPAATLRWPETAFAALLFIAGVLFWIGWFTGTTAEDRADTNLHWIGLGVLLWLLLEAIPLTAGALQLRERRASSRAPGGSGKRRR
ncbi:hypothetical protein SAMN05421770_101709 [Granulicella rosea]|uniref:Uncharacterized protein n=1 Tax=Granulicella rosea TaxID=474952 RepID=A0A239DYH2_9BACT|nr:hypothetical protein [Granulicella rosea]SNS37397.1 hypothetical protein SAMN05421770_101709 [Granulicella rosea]